MRPSLSLEGSERLVEDTYWFGRSLKAYGVSATHASYLKPRGNTDLRMMISCERQAGAKLALVGRQLA